MRIGPRSNLMNAWGNKLRQDTNIARYTKDPDVQIRIAKNSNHKLVLLNLVINESLSEEAIQKLFNRDISEITSRLKRLGHRSNTWF